MCASFEPQTRIPSSDPKENSMKSLLSALLLAATLLSLSACNTVAGMGKDLKAGGQAISNAADQAK
jgi:predicted small secreted protein